MKSKGLLWMALGLGAIAVAAYVMGSLFSGPLGARGFWGWDRAYDGRNYGYGYGGMMGGGYGGMMGGYGGMMGTAGGPVDTATAPLTLDQARDAANRYLDYWGNSDLKVREIIEFTNNFYARVDEQSAGAFELLIDRNTGVVYPEPGPNMIWNNKYGVWSSSNNSGAYGGYGGMMGGGRYGQSRTSATTDMPVKRNDARERAQKFLDRQLPGAKAQEPDTFYGYYTLEVEKDGRNIGMLSVDGYYGQIWYHSWHGAYLSERQF